MPSTHAVLVEANLIPGWEQGNWSLTALYNLILSDYHEQDDGSPLDYHSVALSTGYLIARKVRLMAEYVLLLEQSVEEVQYTNGHRGLLGLVSKGSQLSRSSRAPRPARRRRRPPPAHG